MDKRKQQLQYVRQAFTPHNKLKILIGFYMIATKVDTVYEVSLPPQVKRMLAAFSVGESFGFNSMGSVQFGPKPELFKKKATVP